VGKPSHAANYTTKVTRLNDEGVEETIQLTGLEAMTADGLDPLAGNYTLVEWDKLLFSAYQNQNSFGMQTLAYYTSTIETVTDTAVVFGNYQSNDIAAGDLNGDGQAEQIAAWIGPGNHVSLSVGEMPGSQRATSVPAAVARGGGEIGGYALQFDGLNDHVTVTGQIALNNASFTISFWGRRDAVGRAEWVLWQGTEATNQGLHIGFRQGNEFACAFYGNDLNTPPYTDTDWHHWACMAPLGLYLRCQHEYQDHLPGRTTGSPGLPGRGLSGQWYANFRP
jgi:hypothetical protein